MNFRSCWLVLQSTPEADAADLLAVSIEPFAGFDVKHRHFSHAVQIIRAMAVLAPNQNIYAVRRAACDRPFISRSKDQELLQCARDVIDIIVG